MTDLLLIIHILAAAAWIGFVHRPGGERLVAALEKGDQAGAAAEAKRRGSGARLPPSS